MELIDTKRTCLFSLKAFDESKCRRQQPSVAAISAPRANAFADALVELSWPSGQGKLLKQLLM
jgi:hypothetical protein